MLSNVEASKGGVAFDRSSAPPLLAGCRKAQLAGNTLLVIRNRIKSTHFNHDMLIRGRIWVFVLIH
jgi:hypothetical protein